MIKKLRVTVDGNTYDVTVEMPEDSAASAANFGPPQAPALPVSPPPPALAPAVPPVIAAAAPATAPAPAAATGTAAPAGPGDVPSPLAGRVTAVVVTVGQEVKEGEHLLTLEAMKMNTFVFAPRSGKVAEVKAAVGSAVEEGQTLIRIE